jgi:hypothetical protein
MIKGFLIIDYRIEVEVVFVLTFLLPHRIDSIKQEPLSWRERLPVFRTNPFSPFLRVYKDYEEDRYCPFHGDFHYKVREQLPDYQNEYWVFGVGC